MSIKTDKEMSNNNFEIKGEIVEIKDEQVFSEKFKKRDFVIRTLDDKYEQFVKFQTINERCDLLDKMKVGEDVIVHFNLKGRPYEKGGETIYFTNLEAWRIQYESAATDKLQVKKVQMTSTIGNDDLPF